MGYKIGVSRGLWWWASSYAFEIWLRTWVLEVCGGAIVVGGHSRLIDLASPWVNGGCYSQVVKSRWCRYRLRGSTTHNG